jgi:hypothetical protein
MRQVGFAFALILFVFGAFSQRTFGQSSASIVEGMVQDATSAVIQDSDLNLLNTETGGKLTTRTNVVVMSYDSVLPFHS